MDINIRQANLNDKTGIIKIADLLHLNIPNFVWNTGQFIEQQIKNNACFVAEGGGAMAGIISLRRRNKKFYVEIIAVAKEYQSKGVGAELINFAKNFTRENGLNILLACSFHEYNAADFYLNNGFSMLKKQGAYMGHKYYCFETKVQ